MPSEASIANLKPPYRPGESGNAGRRNQTYLRAIKAVRKLTPDAIEVLQRCLTDDDVPWVVRLQAANTIIDRVLGKPKDPLEAGGDRASVITSITVNLVQPRDSHDGDVIDGSAHASRPSAPTLSIPYSNGAGEDDDPAGGAPP